MTIRLRLKYDPFPHQRIFHKNKARYKLLRGGVGSGKTVAGAHEALFMAIRNPGCDGMIVAPTWGILHRTTLRGFLAILPQKLIRDTSKSERWIELHSGARIYYGSADRPETLEGADLAWIWGDEGRYWKKTAWPIIIARVRDPKAKRREIAITSTPEIGWMYDLWTSDDPDYFSVLGKTSDNTKLEKSFDASLKKTYSSRLYQQYADGEWVSGSGNAFPEFNLRIHVQDDLIPDRGSGISIAVDFGINNPSYLFIDYKDVCYRHGSRNCIHVVGEKHPNDTPTIKLVPMISADTNKRGWVPLDCIVDPAGDARSIQTGERDTALFNRVGLNAVFATDRIRRDIKIGVDHIKGKLDPMDGPPSLYIDSSLDDERGITKALARAEADVKKGVYLKDGVFDHALDALRYGINWLDPPVVMGISVV